MKILAIDPGTAESGLVLFDSDTRAVSAAGVTVNDEVLEWIRAVQPGTRVVCEMIASYGMPVGREVFETCVWIGRMQQVAPEPDTFGLIYRQEVKLHLCGSPRAKDAHIRQALIDLLGPAGTKKNPGPT